MTTTFVEPGGHNTYIPSTQATENMVVDFSRNPNDFALAKYAQYVPVKLNNGRYTRITIEVAGRILQVNNADTLWPDGTDAQLGHANRESFGYFNYRTERHQYPVNHGELAAEQASWELLATASRQQAQRAMTARTQEAITLLETDTAAVWGTSRSTVATMDGVTGKHDVSTTARKDIKRSFDVAARTIQLNTLSAVRPGDMMVVVGPDWARKVSVSQEIVDHIKQSPAALGELEDGLGPNNRYGLPSQLYGYPIVIEDTAKVTSRKGATDARSFVMDGDKVVMLSRPGGLEGVEGAPSFSTCTVFLKEEMTVESKHDRDNRRHTTRVVDDFEVVLTAPVAGFLMTDALT